MRKTMITAFLLACVLSLAIAQADEGTGKKHAAVFNSIYLWGNGSDDVSQAFFDYQGAVYGDYDQSVFLVLKADVAKIEKTDNGFSYYIYAQDGGANNQDLILAESAERVKQIQVGSEIAIIATYLRSIDVTLTSATGMKRTLKIPDVEAKLIVNYASAIFTADWCYKEIENF